MFLMSSARHCLRRLRRLPIICACVGRRWLSDAPPRYSVRAFLLPGDVGAAEVCDSVAGIRICVAPSKGAELSSYQILGSDGEWVELLHHGNDYTSPLGPGGWQGRGPNLFPAVGRNFTHEQVTAADSGTVAPSPCKYVWNGVTYDLGVHGFLKDTTGWELADICTSEDNGYAIVSLDSSTLSDDIKACYPFPFQQTIKYELREGVLKVTFTTTAGEGVSEAGMPFSIGNHVTFKFPFSTTGSWESGLLRGNATQQYGLTKFSLLDGTTTPRPEFAGDGLSLTDPASCNMVSGGYGDADECYLELVEPGYLSVRVTQLPFADKSLYPERYFVMWGDSEGRFFCPEPWLGAPNSLNTHKGIVVLQAGQSFEWGYSITTTSLKGK